MTQIQPPPMTTLAQLTAELPPPLVEDFQPRLVAMRDAIGRKVIVLDDDPTGTQTTHGVPVMTQWSVDLFVEALKSDAPAVFVLTNTRAMTAGAATQLNKIIAQQLRAARARTGKNFVIISRSDSTLRGHFPQEPEVLSEALDLCDAWVLTPYFKEGGRFTIGDVHYVQDGDQLLPASQTPFAKDHAFGYISSNLQDWVVEKTGGRIPRDKIVSLSLEEIRTRTIQELAQRLSAVPKGGVIVINAVVPSDMQKATLALMTLEQSGKHFLYRTAASFVQSRSAIVAKPPMPGQDLLDGQGTGGLVVAGSYVPKTTQQLAELKTLPGLLELELDVQAVLHGGDVNGLLDDLAKQVEAGLDADRVVLLMTSRKQQTGRGQAGLGAGQLISDALVGVVERLTVRPRWLMAKGGITSSDVATQGCQIQMAQVLGQIIPGVPVWRCGGETRFPGMAYVVFPGNVGGPGAVREAVERLGDTLGEA